MVQLHEIRLQFHGNGAIPCLFIDGKMHEAESKIEDDYGLFQCRLDERFFRILIVLALRRINKPRDYWVEAEELSLLVDGKISGSGIRKYLERRFSSYEDDDLKLSLDKLPATHLIQYKPRQVIVGKRGGWRGGLSRGPYRLGDPSTVLKCNENECWRYLLGREQSTVLIAEEPQQVLLTARDISSRGRFIESRELVISVLNNIYSNPKSIDFLQSKDRLAFLADCWDLLGNIEMELGISASALSSSCKARKLYEAIHHPAGIAHALQVEAHSLGQMNNRKEAVQRLKLALWNLDQAPLSLRKGVGRAGYVGGLGQQLSVLGSLKEARRKMMFALAKNEEAGHGPWVGVWMLRLAKNSLKEGKISGAIDYLEKVKRLTPIMKTEHMTLFYRTSGEIMVASGDWSQALKAIEAGYQLSLEHLMANEIKELQPVIGALRERGLWDRE